jgi:Na+/H+ antiporter NhaC
MSYNMEFRGGPWVSFVPLAVFILGTAALVISGAPDVQGMIIAAMVGISIGIFLSKDVPGYSERVFSLMANRTATVAIIAWLWAGAFSGILAASGLVEAIVWVGLKLHLTGAGFTVAVFLSSALFAVSVGTGVGTVLGFTAVMYPAGIVLGCNPAALMGAIFSGAAFGDNLAPISDTTIVSAATQETDIGGVVKSRLKYVLPVAGVSALLFLVFGGGRSIIDPAQAEQLMAETADPAGLPMLIPAAVVFIVAVSGRHFLAALTAGIASALVVGPLFGVFPLSQVFHLAGGGTVGGSAVSGAIAMLPICVLTLLMVTAIGVMGDAGFLDQVMAWLDKHVARGVRGAEAAIIALVSFANVCVSVNTVAMITVGPLANQLRKRHDIHSYRSANLLDTTSCSFPYALPWASTMVAAIGIQHTLVERYDFAVVVPWSQAWPYVFYGLLLFPAMILAVITGYGRRQG